LMTPRRDGNAGDDLRAWLKQSHDLLRQIPFTAADIATDLSYSLGNPTAPTADMSSY